MKTGFTGKIKENHPSRRTGLDFGHHVYYSGHMDTQTALVAFDALSQETRLKAFRLLVGYGTEGCAAGTLSAALGVPHNSLSFHLAHMGNAGLVLSRREGRSIIYSANFTLFTALIRFMVKDCCSVEFASIRDDKARGCSIVELAGCCPPQKKEKKK
jgi:ArsR family transcriptional regulator, arsenate/arsenite/antimonite-responsive transcriptional repressor